eukprot:6189590-Pleurochrysis_carterae.AAC.1
MARAAMGALAAAGVTQIERGLHGSIGAAADAKRTRGFSVSRTLATYHLGNTSVSSLSLRKRSF